MQEPCLDHRCVPHCPVKCLKCSGDPINIFLNGWMLLVGSKWHYKQNHTKLTTSNRPCLQLYTDLVSGPPAPMWYVGELVRWESKAKQQLPPNNARSYVLAWQIPQVTVDIHGPHMHKVSFASSLFMYLIKIDWQAVGFFFCFNLPRIREKIWIYFECFK